MLGIARLRFALISDVILAAEPVQRHTAPTSTEGADVDPQEHAHWIAQANALWKQHQPRRYKALLQSGQLTPALKAAAEATSRDMEELRPQVGQDSAWEMVRERHLFPLEENGNSPQVPRSAGWAPQITI